MADKRATVYVVDVGASTRKFSNGKTETGLDYGLRYVWAKIGETMAANRAGWSVGVVAFRTEKTQNHLDADGYEFISVLKPLGPIDLSHVNDLRSQLVTNEQEAGDAISAVVVAISMITEFTTLKSGKTGKFDRKIVLVTDGQGYIDSNDYEEIARKINDSGIELVVIGIDFDDHDFGFIEEDKSPLKRSNEKILKELVDVCDSGLFGTAAEAVQQLALPSVKATKPYATYEGRLSLGDYEKYPQTAMCIDVKRFSKTKRATVPSASNFSTAVCSSYGKSSPILDTEMANTSRSSGLLSAVRNARTYRVNDPSGPGAKRDVELENLARGFQYGSTVVPISKSDEGCTNFETFASFSIVGFIPNEKYQKHFTMGESCITIAQPFNDKARMALSSFIHALFESESYAVARIVTKNGKEPLMILLAPLIEPHMLEALVDVPLPFAEDVRAYRFPPLDRVMGTSGAIQTKHRNLPTDELVTAMGDYVDAMDLSTLGRDDEGEAAEYMAIGEVYNPIIHRIDQAICERALYPNKPVGPPTEELSKFSSPPPGLILRSARQLQRLIGASLIQKVEPEAKSRRGRKNTVKPLSGLDIDSLLEKSLKISATNAIPEFKQMLTNSSADSVVQDAANQMGEIIRTQITHSLEASDFLQALENIRVMRDEMVAFELPGIYNDFIRDLKMRLTNEQLFSDKRQFLIQMKIANLGLIDLNTSKFSDVTEDEARKFYIPALDRPGAAK